MESIEIIKLVAGVSSGGLAGALVTYTIGRWNARIVRLPLIVKMNKRADSNLNGLALARIVKSETGTHLERVEHVREYFLTLRNTSSLHLKEPEILLEFPAIDVEGWHGRPTLSNTPIVGSPLAENSTTAHKRFRYKIPLLPAGSEVDFYFRAIRPDEDTFEASLHNCDRAIVEQVSPDSTSAQFKPHPLRIVFGIVGIVALLAFGWLIGRPRAPELVFLDEGKCLLSFESKPDTFTPLIVGTGMPPPEILYPELQVWRVDYLLQNVGTESCVVAIPELSMGPAELRPGEKLSRAAAGRTAAGKLPTDILIGANVKKQVLAWRIK